VEKFSTFISVLYGQITRYKDRYGYNASFYTTLKLLEHEINLEYTYRLSSYLTANTMNLHFKFQLVKANYEYNNYSLR